MARLHCGKTTTNYRSGAGQEQCGGAAHEPARSVRRDIAPDDRQVAELALLHGSRRQGEPHLIQAYQPREGEARRRPLFPLRRRDGTA